MKMYKIAKLLMIFVGLSGFSSVLFGAWLAHAGEILEPTTFERLNTALQYQFLHTFALLIVLLCFQMKKQKLFVIVALGFMLGILLFSGSLYLKSFFDLSYIGKFAPIGGVTFALSWLLLGFVSSQYFFKIGE